MILKGSGDGNEYESSAWAESSLKTNEFTQTLDGAVSSIPAKTINILHIEQCW